MSHMAQNMSDNNHPVSSASETDDIHMKNDLKFEKQVSILTIQNTDRKRFAPNLVFEIVA